MATYLGKQKIGAIVPVEFGGKYNIESVILDDTTQELKITTEETVDKPINKDLEVTKVTLDEVDIPVAGNKPAYNFMPYLVKYIEQEDGTYEMQISDYIEGGEGEKVLIGTQDIEDSDLVNLYIIEGGLS